LCGLSAEAVCHHDVARHGARSSREFWESVDRGAAKIANAPTWKKAGITLDERQFETFPAQQDALADADGCR
jgi:hypothetical protein